MNDLDLLRRYEPVARYTQGEMFHPCAVDGYLELCSLWMADAERNRTLIAGPGEVTAELLAQQKTVPPGNRLFLQFVTDPLDPLAYERWRRRPDRPRLHNPNRLERVGLVNRIMDGLFDVGLVVRGAVPGGTAAAAQQQYRKLRQGDPRRVYYGRVERQGGYIVLQYIFFYVMNDWRSSFRGVNDHESDWEQVFVYLSEEEAGPPVPRWVAYASHDFQGDDLRRHWDDPEVQKVDGTHPVIYVGAGSHASYFTAGEYLMQAEPEFLAPLHGVAAAFDRFWRDMLRQGGDVGLDRRLRSLTSVPYIDYARGDGLCIGPGQQEDWSPILISDAIGWVDGYRGLWGLDTWDPLGGERAPAGPKYERSGAVRLSWNYSLQWAGLDKVMPPSQKKEAVQDVRQRLAAERAELERRYEVDRKTVRDLEVEVGTLQQAAYLSDLLQRREAMLQEAQQSLQQVRQRLADVIETEKASAAYLARLERGDPEPLRTHIHHAHTPQPPTPASKRSLRWWAAISGGLLLLAIAALLVVRPTNWPFWMATVVAVFAGIEAAVHDRLTKYLLGLTLLLAAVTGVILLIRFWWLALLAALVLFVIVMIRDNLREIADG